jgi:CMP-N,N'-diacetyllegionaminic acid synthase
MTHASLPTIATVCARGGSKGLPRKNVLAFAGEPLIVHTIRQAFACPLISGVYVSTDDDEIADIARRHGATVPYRRPADLASDGAAKIPVVEHLVRHLEAQGQVIGRIVDLQPTSPLRIEADLQAAIGLADRAEVVTVTQPSHNPYYTLVETQQDGTLRLSMPTALSRRQDAPAVWGLNGSIYVWSRAALARAAAEGFWSVAATPSPMPRERSVDIDDLLDFELAEWFLWRRSAQMADSDP